MTVSYRICKMLSYESLLLRITSTLFANKQNKFIEVFFMEKKTNSDFSLLTSDFFTLCIVKWCNNSHMLHYVILNIINFAGFGSIYLSWNITAPAVLRYRFR